MLKGPAISIGKSADKWASQAGSSFLFKARLRVCNVGALIIRAEQKKTAGQGGGQERRAEKAGKMKGGRAGRGK